MIERVGWLRRHPRSRVLTPTRLGLTALAREFGIDADALQLLRDGVDIGMAAVDDQRRPVFEGAPGREGGGSVCLGHLTSLRKPGCWPLSAEVWR